jgi:predicted MFS family arabinose efflux permease
VQVAAVICASVPFVVAVMTWWAVREERSKLNVEQLKGTAMGLWAGVRSIRLWLVLVFLVLGTFRPGMVTPMYDHVMKRLKVDESFNSILDTLGSLGMALGAALFMGVLSKRFSTHKLIVIGLIAAAASMVPFFFITSKAIAYAANVGYGVGYILASLASLSIAAEACPKRAEGTVFAAMMAISNVGLNYGDKLGSTLYERTFHFNVHPLVGISIAFTLAGLVLVPFLPSRPVDAPDDTPGFPVLPPDGSAPSKTS